MAKNKYILRGIFYVLAYQIKAVLLRCFYGNFARESDRRNVWRSQCLSFQMCGSKGGAFQTDMGGIIWAKKKDEMGMEYLALQYACGLVSVDTVLP